MTRAGTWEPVSVTRSHFLSCKNQCSRLLTEPKRPPYNDKHANAINSDPLPLPGSHSIRLGFLCQQSHSDCPTLQRGQTNHISHNPPGSSATFLRVVFMGPVQPSSVEGSSPSCTCDNAHWCACAHTCTLVYTQGNQPNPSVVFCMW